MIGGKTIASKFPETLLVKDNKNDLANYFQVGMNMICMKM